MGFGQNFKLLLRTPLKSLLTLVLTALVSFSFFSQACKFLTTSTALEEASDKYIAAGAVRNTAQYIASKGYNEDPAFSAVSTEQLKAVAALPHIKTSSLHYIAPAISPYQRVCENTDEGNHGNVDYYGIFEGTVLKLEHGTETNGTISRKVIWVDITVNKKYADNQKYIKGIKEFIPEGQDIRITWDLGEYDEGKSPELLKTPDIEALKPGNSYVFIINSSGGDGNTLEPHYRFFQEKPIDVTALADNYLETPDFAWLARKIDFYKSAFNTVDAIFLSDMNTLMMIAEKTMMVTQGRAITASDTGKVCVVSKMLADANNLKLGDIVPLSIVSERINTNIEATGSTSFYVYMDEILPMRQEPRSMSDVPLEELTLEIVGIYDTVGVEMRSHPWGMSANSVFIPLSVMPKIAQEPEYATPNAFGFVLNEVSDVDAFLIDGAETFEAQHLDVIINDMGWAKVSEGFGGSKVMAMLTFAASAIALPVSFALIAYIFITRKKGEYAIMRALGASRSKCFGALTAAIALIGGSGIAIGSAAAWIYTQSSMNAMLSSAGVAYKIPLSTALLCIAVMLALLMTLTSFALIKLGRKSPLALLQAKRN